MDSICGMMKLLCTLCSALLLAPAAALAGGSVPLYQVTVTGSVQVLEPTPTGGTTIKTKALNNNQLFARFGLSKADYTLVLDANGFGEVKFLAKSGMNPVQEVQVFKLANTAALIKGEPATPTKISAALVADVGSTSMGTFFEGLDGRGRGTVKLANVGVPGTTVKAFKFSFAGTGRDTVAAAGNSVALLQVNFVIGAPLATAPSPAAGNVLGIPVE
jgi:hypothetical protein